ncbi:MULTISPECIES: ATP-binding protein [unclassified Dyella]|uniref:ATP-binding protein n=1 Tax=unclassified Dyella TaxID=2634549 RepID=UPI000C861F23|nr:MULTISPECIES: ATP-binding protein [unclassified Dyella]MDR3446730.1 ATP-binding protein [Dyella sp.]PMQ03234.1 Sensor protein QseC [Dyella sp. AD56]
MKSLQWRMLAALGLVIALAWGISIAMYISYLHTGPSTSWRSGLSSLGDTLVKALPDDWVRKQDDVATRLPEGKQMPTSSAQPVPSEPGGLLTAMVLNTVELAIVGILMWWAVVASLRPLRSLSENLARRKAFDSEPLSVKQVPDELRPLILAFNSLLARVDTAMRAERQFIADAAHELRTPLAALHVQAEVALRAEALQGKDDALRKLLGISHRTHRLAEQLLDLARLDAGLHSTGLHDTDLLELAGHVISEFSVQADSRGTRLLLSGTSCMARCDVDEMGILIRNLVDNAIRHGRDAGTVEIVCGDVMRDKVRHTSLEVRDDGPGVPGDEHAAIFARFYRASDSVARGSGIGLSLVAAIAELHDARVETGQGRDGRGFSIRILFPHTGSGRD